MGNGQAVADAQFFSLRSAPELSQGRLNVDLAQAGLLQALVKVYASGGENAMHMHPNEDHLFVVVQGQATFRIGTDDNVRVVGRFEGVMLPRGASYWFQSTAPENLVMLRVGASTNWPDCLRTFVDGKPFDPYSAANKQVDPVKVPGRFFGG